MTQKTGTPVNVNATIVVYENGMNDLPYQIFWTVDLRDEFDGFISRIGTYSHRSQAVNAAYAIAKVTGQVVKIDDTPYEYDAE